MGAWVMINAGWYQSLHGKRLPERAKQAIASVGQYSAIVRTGFTHTVDLRQGDLRLGVVRARLRTNLGAIHPGGIAGRALG